MWNDISVIANIFKMLRIFKKIIFENRQIDFFEFNKIIQNHDIIIVIKQIVSNHRFQKRHH